MNSPFDLMASADFLVPDRDAAVAMVQRVLGFAEPKPRWSWGTPGQGFRVTFCRPHRTLRQSPTLVELIEPAAVDPARPMSEVVWNVAGLAARQGDRPLKTHGAPIASSAVDDLIERVRSMGLRHWVQPSSDAYPFSRLWMGITADELADYRPGGDGGLMLEVIDTRTVGLPADVLTDDAAGNGNAPIDDNEAGTMVRTAARVFLVDNLDRSLGELAHAFTWEPEVGAERGADGSRRAVLGFRLAQSARIELLEPADDSDAGKFLKQWGPGIWHVRIAVSDLDAKAADLRARGTAFARVRTGFEHPGVVLRVDPAATPACRFEFAALGAWSQASRAHVLTISSSCSRRPLTFPTHPESYASDNTMRWVWVIRCLLVALTAALSLALILRGNVAIGVLLGALACTRVVLLLVMRRRRQELRRRFAQRIGARRPRAVR